MSYRMTSVLAFLAAIAAMIPAPAAASAQPRINLTGVADFGPNLADTSPRPEGIAVDPGGTVYATSIPVGPSGVIGDVPQANVSVLARDGRLAKRIPVPAGPSGAVALTGALFVRGSGLFVCDAADSFSNPRSTSGRLLRIDPATGAVTVVAEGFRGPNAVTRDRRGSLYLADGIAGSITRLQPDGSARRTWFSDPVRLGPAAGNFLGANGLAFDVTQRRLYVTNPGTRNVFAIHARRDRSAGRMTVFADGRSIDRRQRTQEALTGADGVQVDTRGNLYVTADWINQLQVLSPRGRLVARFSGSRFNSLHYPASLVFFGRRLLISNLDFFSATSGANSKTSQITMHYRGLPL
jgi:sugar lactone lactonase YvrE